VLQGGSEYYTDEEKLVWESICATRKDALDLEIVIDSAKNDIGPKLFKQDILLKYNQGTEKPPTFTEIEQTAKAHYSS
jgi:hypothetical protein